MPMSIVVVASLMPGPTGVLLESFQTVEVALQLLAGVADLLAQQQVGARQRASAAIVEVDVDLARGRRAPGEDPLVVVAAVELPALEPDRAGRRIALGAHHPDLLRLRERTDA